MCKGAYSMYETAKKASIPVAILLAVGAGVTTCVNSINNEFNAMRNAERSLKRDFDLSQTFIENKLRDFVAQRGHHPLNERGWTTKGSGYRFDVGTDKVAA